MNEYELSNNENYKNWRKIHEGAFGDIFASAFSESGEAQMQLTAALIHISKRKFAEAMPILDLLESLCTNSFDEGAVYYFKGLNHEMLGNEQEMVEYYERLGSIDESFVFPLAFHPYYRTAKFAQRASECKKAVYYYKKALEFYDGRRPTAREAATVSQIIYEVATVYLYMHSYSDCEKFLKLSEIYDPSENQQRNFVAAILYAVQGNRDECDTAIRSLNDFFKTSCEATANAIFEGRDLHYCAVPQDRSEYDSFWRRFLEIGTAEDAQAIISMLLTETLSFAKRQIECRIEKGESSVTVYCKNYRIKTLAAEYTVLFSKKPAELEKWNFISVDEFENY